MILFSRVRTEVFIRTIYCSVKKHKRSSQATTNLAGLFSLFRVIIAIGFQIKYSMVPQETRLTIESGKLMIMPFQTSHSLHSSQLRHLVGSNKEYQGPSILKKICSDSLQMATFASPEAKANEKGKAYLKPAYSNLFRRGWVFVKYFPLSRSSGHNCKTVVLKR